MGQQLGRQVAEGSRRGRRCRGRVGFGLSFEGGEFRLKPRATRKTSRQLLEEMVEQMRRVGPGNEPETVDWGPDRGSEIIDDEYSQGKIPMPRKRR